MAYELETILKVRHFRERKDQEGVYRAVVHLKETEGEEKQADKKLEDYKVWRVAEEDRLFKRIIKQKVKREKITELKQDVAELREKEDALKKALEKAKEEVENAKEKLKEAKAIHMRTIIDLEKISQHKESWLQDWKKEQEALADKEMEEHYKKSE